MAERHKWRSVLCYSINWGHAHVQQNIIIPCTDKHCSCTMLMVLWRLLLDQLQRSNSTSQSWKSLIGFFLVCLPSIFQASFPNTPNTFNIMSWGVGWEQAGPYWILFPVDWNAKKDAKREMDAGGAFLWLLNQGLGKYPIFGGYWELGIKDWENFPFLGGGELGFA